jgi:hypothetical protein
MAYYSTTDFNNENFSYSTDDSSSVSTNHKMQKKMQDEIKRQDPGYFTIRRKVASRQIKLDLYKTPLSYNFRIRNAVSGIYENAKVGTRASMLHFKVALCTGEAGKDPAHLFFDSPEQYEKYFGLKVTDNIKSEWHRNFQFELENQRIDRNKSSELRVR